jgi:uncharacterized protein
MVRGSVFFLALALAAGISEKNPWSLQYAASHGQVNVISMLVGLGVDTNAVGSEGNRALDIACLKGDVASTQVLVEHGADPKLRNKTGSTPLHDAALSGNSRLIELLTAHGADVNAVDTESASTPLHYAASFGRFDAVKILLRLGANRAAKDSKGLTALDVAEHNDHPEIIRLLREPLIHEGAEVFVLVRGDQVYSGV